MRKINRNKVLIILFLFVSSTLSAGDFSLGLSLGFRQSHTLGGSSVINASASYDEWSLNIQMQELEEISGSLVYNNSIGRTLHNEFILHSLYVPEEGGFSDLSYVFSQNIKLWNCFRLYYGIGLQIGLAYSPYTVEYLWSLSPILKAGCELALFPFSIGVGYTLNSYTERSWKAVPIYEGYFEISFDKQNAIRLSGFMREAEFLVDPWHLITAYGIRVGYIYKGSV